jgi:hypothetical protein
MSERVHKAELTYCPLGAPNPEGHAIVVRDWLAKEKAKAAALNATRHQVSHPADDHWHYVYEAWK